MPGPIRRHPIFGHTRTWPDTLFAGSDTSRPIRVRVNPRSRTYRLSINSAGDPLLSVPPRGRLSEAQTFLDRHANWLNVRLERRPDPVAFTHGAEVPLRGTMHHIKGTGQLRGTVQVHQENGERLLLVPGSEAHMARRLTDWLKKQALADVTRASQHHADRLGVAFSAIRVRAQSSRWGSCSSSGRLNYNWRLVLAPPFVLDYVAAHEVAHLCEMNHSARFWATVKQTLPDMERGRAWLKAHGNELMRYGITRSRTTD